MKLKELPKALADTCIGKHPERRSSQLCEPYIAEFKRGDLTALQVAVKIQVVVDDLQEVVAAFEKPDAKSKKKKR